MVRRGGARSGGAGIGKVRSGADWPAVARQGIARIFSELTRDNDLTTAGRGVASPGLDWPG
jgi:hypothetical protein